MADNASDPARPAFARKFPRTDAIDALVRAFERGDFASVRVGAAKLGADVTDAERAAAEELVSRTEADPLVKYLFAFTAALLVFLSAWWMTHDGPVHGEVPSAPARMVK